MRSWAHAAAIALFLAGCSSAELAPEVNVVGGLDTLPPFTRAVAAVGEGDLEFVKGCVESDDRYLTSYDVQGRTLLHIAAATDQREIAEYLVEKGAPVMVEDEDGYLPYDLALSSGASTGLKDFLREAGLKEAQSFQ